MTHQWSPWSFCCERCRIGLVEVLFWGGRADCPAVENLPAKPSEDPNSKLYVPDWCEPIERRAK